MKEDDGRWLAVNIAQAAIHPRRGQKRRPTKTH